MEAKPCQGNRPRKDRGGILVSQPTGVPKATCSGFVLFTNMQKVRKSQEYEKAQASLIKQFYLQVLSEVELPVERFWTMPAAAVWKMMSAPSFR